MTGAVLAGVVLLFLLWRLRRRRRAELLADVEVYRGPKWRVRGGGGYWDFGEERDASSKET